jgi:RND family efflux transporter MFP subunit
MNNSVNNQPAPAEGKRISAGRKILTLVIIILIIGVALLVGSTIIKTAPKPMRKQPVVQAPLVEFKPMAASREQVIVEAMGTVVPAREMSLKSEVSGRVVKLDKNFELGNQVAKGENLVFIETADYELAVAQAQSQVAQAAYDLDIEMGYQDIAVEEWELYDNKDGASQEDQNLALRKPHLVMVQAEYEAAKAELAQAKLDLQRTVISAPFNATVIAKEVELGSMLSAQETVATLVATDSYWVQASIPVDRLKWIDIPSGDGTKGSRVKVTAGDKQKIGRVYKLLADIEESGRMARILVEISDPLDLKRPAKERQPLLLGEFARVEIEGHFLDNVISAPSSALHNGNQVWLLDDEDKLEIDAAEVIWRDSNRVLLTNSFAEGAKLITSNLATPVAGMSLRTEASEEKRIQDSTLVQDDVAERPGPSADRQGPPQGDRHE